MSDGIVRIEALGCDEFLCVADALIDEEGGDLTKLYDMSDMPKFIAADGTWVDRLADAARMKDFTNMTQCVDWLASQGRVGYPIKVEKRPIERDGEIIDIYVFHNLIEVE